MVYCNCEVAVKTSVNVGWGLSHQNSVNVGWGLPHQNDVDKICHYAELHTCKV